MMRKLLLAFSVLGLVALTATPAVASPIVTPTVIDLGDGTWKYSYALTADPTENIFDFQLDFFGDATSIAAPGGGWAFINGFDAIANTGFIDWYAPFDGSADLLAGAVLDGFSFISALGPGLVQSTTVGYNAAIGFPDGLNDPQQGTTVGPAPVPEPATLLLLGSGISALAMRRRRQHQVS